MHTPFVTRNVKSVRLASPQRIGEYADLEISWRYRNRTSKTIILRDRAGQNFILYPLKEAEQNGTLVVTRSVKATQDQITGYSSFMRYTNVLDWNERNVMIRACNEAENLARQDSFSRKHVEFSIDYVITEEELPRTGQATYFHDIDLLVVSSDRSVVKHPQCQEMREEMMYGDVLGQMGNDSLMFFIKIVENGRHKTASSRYINFAGEVYEVPPARDPGLSDGVYLVTRPTITEDKNSFRTTKHYKMSLDDAESKIGLKRTVEEAKWGGPINEVSKTHIENLTARAKLEEASIRENIRVLEREHEERMKYADLRVTKMRGEQQEYKAIQELKADRIKATTKIYDQTSHWVNTGVNLIKVLAGAAVTLAAVYHQFKK